MITLELTPEEATHLQSCIILPAVAKKLSDAIATPPVFVLKYETDNGYKCSCCRTADNHKRSFDDIDRLCNFVAEQELLAGRDSGFTFEAIILKQPVISVTSEYRQRLDEVRKDMKAKLDLQVSILTMQGEIEVAEAEIRYAKAGFEVMKSKLNEIGIAEQEAQIAFAETGVAERRSKLAQMIPPELSKELAAVAAGIAGDLFP